MQNCDPGAFLGLTQWFHSCFVALLCFAVHLLLFVPIRGELKAWGRFEGSGIKIGAGGGITKPRTPMMQV